MRLPLMTTIVLLLASFAVAQDDTAPAPEDLNAPEDLSLGTPIEPQVGDIFVRETHGDWAVRCEKMAEGAPDRCVIYQLLSNAEGAPVAEVNIFALPDGGRAAAGANIVAPLGTLLTEQLTLAVDGQDARRYPFTFCNQGGCIARIGLTSAEVEAFRQGASATMRLIDAAFPDREVVLDLSLTGFTAGYAAATVPTEE